MVLACDGMPVIVACPEATASSSRPRSWRKAISDRTRWLLLNAPSNPTGASYTIAEFRRWPKCWSAIPQVLVMTDDIYEHIRFDGQCTPHLLKAAPQLRDRTLAINGVSRPMR
jgi:aspartate aminotransferase